MVFGVCLQRQKLFLRVILGERGVQAHELAVLVILQHRLKDALHLLEYLGGGIECLGCVVALANGADDGVHVLVGDDGGVGTVYDFFEMGSDHADIIEKLGRELRGK